MLVEKNMGMHVLLLITHEKTGVIIQGGKFVHL